MQWYYAINGQRQGPVAPAEFEKLVTDGVVKPDTLVWHHGMTDWLPYAQAVAVGQAAPPPESDTAVCAVSGKTYPKREMIPYEGKWISAERRDEFFQRLREGAPMPGPATVPGPYGYGGFWRRFGARFVDGLILGVSGMIIGAVIGAIFGATGMLRPGAGRLSGGLILMQVLVQAINMAMAISYEVYFVRKNDATPGKQALGLKVLRADGSKLSVGRIIGRYFAQWLSALPLLIGYIMAAFDDEKRALHDRVCDTRVIKTK